LSDIKAIFSSLFAVATVSLVLRLYVRQFMTIRKFELEDYIIILAWVFLTIATFLSA
jgi:hypothetical protein